MDQIVFDTSSLIGAAWRDSVPAQALHRVIRNYQLVHSDETADEVLEVFTRPRILSMAGRDNLTRVLYDVIDHSMPVKADYQLPPLAADPKDTKFLELALSAEAKYIISSDRHLLNLKHYGPSHNPIVQIVSPAHFLRDEQCQLDRWQVQNRQSMPVLS